jgi:sugar/nucleoside kinase (ribokinase family)
MNNADVYLYGMTVLSTIHQLKAKFPSADGYQEIARTFVIPGGEAANGAIVLSNLGITTTLDGPFLGDLTAEPLLAYLQKRNVDCSLLHHHPGFPGWRDIVFCDGVSRTVFGWFVDYLFGGHKFWNAPSESAIQSSKCVALDPFFGSESQVVAELCLKNHKDYVTIDSRFDSIIAKGARAIACSREFLDREYPGVEHRALLKQYQSNCAGLVIFTFGSHSVLFASPKTHVQSFQPYPIEPVDTLAAGDTFRAGVVYGILKGWSDAEVVRFASATAAVSCLRFPSVYEPPTLAEITALMNSRPD